MKFLHMWTFVQNLALLIAVQLPRNFHLSSTLSLLLSKSLCGSQSERGQKPMKIEKRQSLLTEPSADYV